MCHVYGHMDRILRVDQISLQERLNCLVDALVDEALLTALQSNQFILNEFPFEEVCIYIGGKGLLGQQDGNYSTFGVNKLQGRFSMQEVLFIPRTLT